MTYDFSDRSFHGRYKLLRQIGVGGMATVYEATDLQLDKRVAVKVLNPDLARDKLHVARFQQEARSAVKIRHDHLVNVTDQNVTAEGVAYFVMEYLEGQSLGQIVHAYDGPMPWQRVVDIALQVCEALGVAHERGVIHRDIKPGNVFITQRKEADHVKVLDLGIAKLLSHPRDPSMPPSTHASQGVVGTPEYMAPEQARGEPCDHRVDLYSLGIMLYRLLTGQLPFYSAQSPFVTMEMQCTRAPVPLHIMAPHTNIPMSIERITLRALAKAPDDRWASAQELAEALRRARDAELLQRDRTSPRDATTRYYRSAPARPLARKLQIASTILGGMATAGTMFMVMMLVDVRGGRPASARPDPVPSRDIVDAESGRPALAAKRSVGDATPAPGPASAPGPAPAPTTEPASAPKVPDVPPIVSSPGREEPTTPQTPPAKANRPGPGTTKLAPVRSAEDAAEAVVKRMVKGKERRISNICVRLLDTIDDYRDVKVEMELDPGTGALTAAHALPPNANALGRCVEAELMAMPFGKLTAGLKRHVVAMVKVKR